MRNLFVTTFKIRAATGANRWMYFVQRIPLLGKLVPDKIYTAGQLKTAVTFITTIFRELMGFATKFLYLLGMVVLPAALIRFDTFFADYSTLLPEFLHILFWLSCLFPLFSDSQVMRATKEKFIAIKYMRADVNRYILATVPARLALFFVSFFPALLFCTTLVGGTVPDTLKIFLLLIAFRLLAEAFQLWWFARTGFAMFRKAGFGLTAIVVALLGAYLPPLVGWPLMGPGVLLSAPLLVALAALGIFCCWYIFGGKNRWRRAVMQNLKAEYVEPSQSTARQSAFRDVQMREEDLQESPDAGRRIAHKTGYAYFNALFFMRHNRQLFRPVVIRLLIVAAITVAAVAWLLLAPERPQRLFANLASYLPFFVFIMYAASMGAKACKAMFYNCDISLLRYPFYRKASVIVKNFNIRLRYVAAYNFIVGAAICAACILLVWLAGGAVASLAMAAFCGCIMLLSLFFSVHHMFLYYVFQPYTTDLNVKNPFFNLFNTLVYFASFACMQIETAGIQFAFGVLGVTLLYIFVALALVYFLSPKKFRVK